MESLTVKGGQLYCQRDGLDQIIYSLSDDLSGDLAPAGGKNYYGYLANNGWWIIVQENPATGAYRYAQGVSGYSAAIADPTVLTYVLWSSIK